MKDRMLDTKEAAAFIGIGVSTLYQWRTEKRGPRYIDLGKRIIYRESDILLWLESKTRDPEKEKETA
jgi:predicted DNA-binding transcriptional regulator AlpA